MFRYLIICASLLAACGGERVETRIVATYVPADLRTPCDGWTSGSPQTEQELILAAHSEQQGRRCANAKIASIDEILTNAETGDTP